MTVGELIEALKEYNSDTEVVLYDQDFSDYSPINEMYPHAAKVVLSD